MLINNQILKNIKSGLLFRLIYQNDETLYLIDLDTNRFPYIFDKKILLKQLEEGEVEFFESIKSFAIDDFLLTEETKIKRDYYWNLLKDLLSQEPQIYEKKFRRSEIRKITSVEVVSEQTLNDKLKSYWIAGKVKNALAPEYVNCGGRGKEKQSNENKRGRKRSVSKGEGVNVDSAIRKMFEISLNKYYYTSARKSLKLTYELMLNDYFTDQLKNNEDVPTYNQYHYWFSKSRNIKKLVSTRYSQKTFLKDYRAIPSSIDSLEEVKSPGYFEIDANLSDFYICSEFDRSKIIGRANIYLVVDVFSRMIISTYVGLEVNDYSASSLAIQNIASDKIDLCKKYGVDIEYDQWPIEKGTLPNYLISDRAELRGTRVDSISNSLGIEFRLCSAYRADFKGVCERAHRTISELITPHVTGAIISKNVERGDRDYRVKATLTLKEATRIVLKAIVFYNNFQVLENYQRDEDMIIDGVKPIPIEIFKWGIAKRTGMLKKFDYELIKKVLLPSDKGRMTSKGIKFKGLYYVTKEHFLDESYVKARQSTWQVDISYDPRNLDVIYHRIDGNFIECKISERSKRFEKTLLEDIEFIKKMEREEISDLDKIRTIKKMEFINEVDQIVESSKKQVGVRNSDKKSIQGIRNNRRREIILSQDRDQNIPEMTNEILEESENDYLDLILKNQGEVLDNDEID